MLGQIKFGLFKQLKIMMPKISTLRRSRNFPSFLVFPKRIYIPKEKPPTASPRTLTKWLSVIDGNPGITKAAVESVKSKIGGSKQPLVFMMK